MKRISVDDGTFYAVFSLLLSFIILYMFFSFQTELMKATESLTHSECMRIIYNLSFFNSSYNNSNITIFNETSLNISIPLDIFPLNNT